MAGYVTNIEQDTLNNDNFRKVIFTAFHSQLVLMSLLPEVLIMLRDIIFSFMRIFYVM